MPNPQPGKASFLHTRHAMTPELVGRLTGPWGRKARPATRELEDWYI